jgi:glutamyl-tRNA synthetase
MNAQHLMRLSSTELVALVAPHVVREGWASDTDVQMPRFHELVELFRVRARTAQELAEKLRPYLTEEIEYEASAVAKHWKDRTATAELLRAIRDRLSAHASWDAASLEESLRALADANGVGAGKLFQPLRVALTGSSESPGMFDVLVVLGRDRTLARLDRARIELAEA